MWCRKLLAYILCINDRTCIAFLINHHLLVFIKWKRIVLCIVVVDLDVYLVSHEWNCTLGKDRILGISAPKILLLPNHNILCFFIDGTKCERVSPVSVANIRWRFYIWAIIRRGMEFCAVDETLVRTLSSLLHGRKNLVRNGHRYRIPKNAAQPIPFG